MTLAHVLCSNFKENGSQEVSETVRCFGDKSWQNAFFAAILRPFGRGRQTFAAERAT